MTIKTINVESLKKVKDSIIGNPSAKLQLAQDQLFVRTLVECLNPPSSSFLDPQTSTTRNALRIEVAHVISSLSYGSEEALAILLRSDALRAFLYAISNFKPSDNLTLRSAFARAMRALSVSLSDVVGPSQWGLKADKSEIRSEAKEAINYLFQVDSLDIYLPLLVDTSTQTSTYVAQFLAFTVRTPDHRKAITEWLPPSDRAKEVKSKRGWEKASATNANGPSRQGGWVARNLTGLLRSKDCKLQEGALLALASLSKENPSVAGVLAKPPSDRDAPSAFSTVLSLTKSRQIDVQLAACLCATHILRGSSTNHSSPLDDTCVRAIMNIVNRMIATPSSDSAQHRTKACFILYYLVADDASLCYTAYERGCLEKLSALVQLITPLEPLSEWDEDEAESVSCLREAALTAIAAISLFDNDVRRAVTDDLRLLPYISTSLSHKHPGIRYAACQCVRALSRAVAVLRTNIVDSGLGMQVFGIFKKEKEDRRVTGAALSAVCNIVNEFSPLRPIYLEQGLMRRLVQVLHSGEPSLRLSAVWAIKNLLRKTSTETKRDIMHSLGWTQLTHLLSDTDKGVQEQALNVVRNIAENEDGIDMVFKEIGSDILLERITSSLSSAEEDITLQASAAVANLANGTEFQQNMILAHPQLLLNLRVCLAESKAEVRRHVVACILELVRRNPKRRKVMADCGIISTLRHLCEWTGVGVASSPSTTGPLGVSFNHGGPGGGRTGSVGGFYGSWGGSGSAWPYHAVVDDDKDVIDQAKMALDWLEHGDAYVTNTS